MNPSGEQLRLIQQETPNWLEAVNDDTGKNVRKNLEKTTASNISLVVLPTYTKSTNCLQTLSLTL